MEGKVTLIFDRVLNTLAFAAGAIIFLSALCVCIGVVSRYYFGHPQIWVVETTEYALLFVTFLGTAWLLREEGHIKVELVLTRLNPRTQVIVNMVTSIICAIIFFIIAWYGVRVTYSYFKLNYQMPTILKPPQYIILAVIPSGSILLFIQMLRSGYGYLKNLRIPQDQKEQVSVKPEA